MFILLRRIERWLHQHIFKVGWLSTHDYHTTTILYYTFFLPGVILHEVVYYLVAGMVNVRAESQIKWPDEQAVGELKLNFVKLAPRTSAFRKAIITSAPLLVGLVCIWLIANNIFNITAVFDRMSSGELNDIGAGFDLLLSAPLFWLWVYIIFTIANTMFPTVPKDLRGWRTILIGLGVVGLATFIIGIGGEIFEALQTPLSTIILVLTETFILLIIIDLLMVAVLGLIEYSIERVTGHSATFKGNKMITMTREELLAEREKEREREQRKREREDRRRQANTGGPTSIYAIAFEIPGAPKDVGITQLEMLPEVDIPEEVPQEDERRAPSFGGLSGDGSSSKPLTAEERKQREAIATRINLPPRKPTTPPPPEIEEVIEDDKPITQQEAITEKETNKPTPVKTDVNDSSLDDSDEDHTSRVEPVVPSRFGASSRFGQSPSVPETSDDTSDIEEIETQASDDDKQSIKPIGSRFGSRFSKPDETDSNTEDTPEPSTPARFGGRFGVSAEAESEDDEPEETMRIVGRPASPSLVDDDESIARDDNGRDAIASLFDGMSIDDEADEDESLDESIARREGGRDAIASLFDGMSVDNDEDDSDDESIGQFGQFGATDSSSRFGSRFGGLSPTSSEGDDDTDSSLVGSRFRSGQRPIAPFGQSSAGIDNDSDDEDESISTPRKRLGGTRPVSRFGTSRPAPKPSFTKSDDEEEEEGDSIDKRRTSPFGSRFGTSSPVVSSDDDITYEDIDDEYEYEDDDEYVDYEDEDDIYYEDEDD